MQHSDGERQNREWERPEYDRERQGQGRERPNYGRGWERQGRSERPDNEREYQGYGGGQQDWERQNYENYGSGQHAGRGPKGYQRSDERIKEEVCDRLTQHPAIDASELEVEVKNREVTLKGTVDRRAEKHLAENLAESVSGVMEIHNQIRMTQGKQTQQNGQTQSIRQGQKGR
ncbi:MAG: BON domain-containing protein [Candidatus Binatia bacterium]